MQALTEATATRVYAAAPPAFDASGFSFAVGVVRPAASEWDEREETPWPIIQEAAKIGLYGFEAMMQFSADPSGLTVPLVLEEVFWGDGGIGMAIMGTGLATAGILANATPEQMSEWIPQCFGTPEDPQVAAFCVSEPDAGSDVAALRTTAKYDAVKDEWVLNGQKAWATNGGIANIHIVVAAVDRDLGARGQASFVIPPDTKGLEMGTKIKKHGLRASHTADVFLDDCRIPAACLLGGKERLDERLGARTRGQRLARPGGDPYDYALGYAKERKQFGRAIIENQAIAFTLADIKLEIDAARLLIWQASWMARNNLPFTGAEGSMSKLRQARSRSGRPSARSRSSGATVTHASSPSSAGTATPRSTRSSRARARSSDSSSPAPSPAFTCSSSPGPTTHTPT